MELIATAHNNGFIFGKEIQLEEGKKYKLVIEKIKEEKINPKILAMVGLIKTDEDTEDFKKYISENKRLDYENIRWY